MSLVDSRKSVALQPSEGQSLSFWGLDLTFKVRGKDTGGAYTIFELIVPPHLPSPPLHLHTPGNGGDVPLRGLTTIPPAILDEYFTGLAELAASGPPSTDRLKGISERHGMVHPPL